MKNEIVLEAFKKYLMETFEEEYDIDSFRHVTHLAVFEAGWEAHAWEVSCNG